MHRRAIAECQYCNRLDKPYRTCNIIPYYPAGSPSFCRNLTFASSDYNNSVRIQLQWDPPLDNGGAAITDYQIFVNSSEVLHQVVSNDTDASIVLNSTGEYFIQIRAINCIGAGPSISASVDITGELLLLIRGTVTIMDFN